jgi:hypothetical protein
VLSQKLLRLVGLWADAYCLLVVLLLLGSLCAAGTESLKRARALLEKPEHELTDQERSHIKMVDGSGGKC